MTYEERIDLEAVFEKHFEFGIGSIVYLKGTTESRPRYEPPFYGIVTSHWAERCPGGFQFHYRVLWAQRDGRHDKQVQSVLDVELTNKLLPAPEKPAP